ncbi:MAG: YncE family protein [Sulfuriferula sp.]
MKKSTLVLMLFALFVTAAQSVPAAETKYVPFQVAATYSMPGDEEWDFLALDTQHHHLFVSRSHHVQVVDTETGALVGDIPYTEGVHGIAIDPEDGLGYTSNGKTDSVTVFKLADLQIVATASTSGADPDVILYVPELKQIYTFNGDGHNISVFNAHTHTLVRTIDIGATPEFAVSDHHGHIFFNIEDTSEIGVIDTNMGTITHRWLLPNCPGPTGLALDNINHRLFSTCQNHQLSITDATSGRPIGNAPIGEHPDAVVFDAKTKEVLVSNDGGTLTVIQQLSPNRYVVLDSVNTRLGAKTMAFDPNTRRIFMMGRAPVVAWAEENGKSPQNDTTKTHPASLLLLSSKR